MIASRSIVCYASTSLARTETSTRSDATDFLDQFRMAFLPFARASAGRHARKQHAEHGISSIWMFEIGSAWASLEDGLRRIGRLGLGGKGSEVGVSRLVGARGGIGSRHWM